MAEAMAAEMARAEGDSEQLSRSYLVDAVSYSAIVVTVGLFSSGMSVQH